MTINISDNDPRIHYTATAGQTLFIIPFAIFDDNDLLVYVNGVLKTITSDYTIANSEVTLLSAASLGDKIALTRNVPIERTTDLTSSYSASAIDDQLDRIVSQIADLDDKAGRSIQIADSELATSLDLPLVDDRKGKTIQFNSVTGALEAGPTSNDIATIANNITGILAADDEAAAAALSATAAAASATAAQTAETAAELAEANAETAKTNAAASAVTAASEAATATTKSGEASTSAAAAATSETNAATSETNAATSASAAEASKDATLAALDSFDDRYLGQKATDPTVDNDGDALVSGALYFNATDDVMKVYDGSLWVAAYASLSGAVLQANNLSDLANVATSRTNLGLGSAATTESTAYATAAQGALADTATQPSDLGTAAAANTGDFATAAQGALADTALQPALAGVTSVDAATVAALGAAGVGGATSSIVKYATAPSVGDEGSVYYNTATNKLFLSNGSAWLSITNKPPLLLVSTLAFDSDLNATVSKDFSEYFADSNGDTLTYTVTGTLPTGTSFSGSTLSGTATVEQTGTFYIVATDQEGLSSPQQTVNYTIALPKIVATGGSVTTDGNFKVHTFTGSGTFDVTNNGFAEILIVAGGGSGGAGDHAGGGGGGAGGLVYGSNIELGVGSYSVVVGAGGAQTTPNQSKTQGNDGSDSSVAGVATAYGGGGGGAGFHISQSTNTGRSGGSSGGSGHTSNSVYPPTRGLIQSAYSSGMTAYGNSGGPCSSGWDTGSGGGGGAGQAGTGNAATAGGNGLQYNISGSDVYYAGGGGGGTNGVSGLGGLGGGGQGYYNGNGEGTTAGAANTGGGGGGGGINASVAAGSNAGGSGVVIIRYETGA